MRLRRTSEVEPIIGAAGSRKPRVLVAEDDGAMRALLVRALRHDGYDADEVGSGAELLHRLGTVGLAGREAPDLIITDVRMPGFDGLDVLAAIREEDGATPVIVITAFGDAATHTEARRLGAAAVFDKPFDVDDLLTATMHALEVARGRGMT